MGQPGKVAPPGRKQKARIKTSGKGPATVVTLAQRETPAERMARVLGKVKSTRCW